jgi:hypothetical protein
LFTDVLSLLLLLLPLLQPIFLLIEATIRERGNTDHLAVQSVGIRIAHVVCVTLIAIVIPFFGSLMVSVITCCDATLACMCCASGCWLLSSLSWKPHGEQYCFHAQYLGSSC